MARFRRKAQSKAAKVNPQIVLQIRAEYDQGQTQGELARKYHISVVQIGRIVRGESWQHLAAPAYEEVIDESAALIDSAVPIVLSDEDMNTLMRDLSAVKAMPEFDRRTPEETARMAAYGARVAAEPPAQPTTEEQPTHAEEKLNVPE